MKKLSFFCMLVFVFSLMAGSAFAQSYCQDVLEPGNPGGRTTGLKTCDTVNPETLNPGDTFSIDIWAAEIPESIISSGFEMFYNPAQVSLVSVLAYDGVDIAVDRGMELPPLRYLMRMDPVPMCWQWYS